MKAKVKVKVRVKVKKRKMPCYSKVVKCSGRVQCKGFVASILLSAHFKRMSGLLYATAF